jgi:hypothetical protein
MSIVCNLRGAAQGAAYTYVKYLSHYPPVGQGFLTRSGAGGAEGLLFPWLKIDAYQENNHAKSLEIFVICC